MKYLLLLPLFLTVSFSSIYAQGVKVSVNPGTPDPSAVLEVESTSKGFLMPRMTTNNRNAIVSPAIGLQIYNTTTDCIEVYFPNGWHTVACDGCSNPPSAAFTFSPNPGTINVPVVFTGPVIPGGSYSWVFQGGSPSTSNIQNPSVTWTNAGTYTITLTVTDQAGCTATSTVSIVIQNCPPPGGNVASFAFTGGSQTWTVPNCVTSIVVDARGAQGGCSNGGLGGRVQATLTVTPGEVLSIYVGGNGQCAASPNSLPGGYNGGGATSPSASWVCASGGGATDIRRGGTALTDRILVAGGGGGAGYNNSLAGHGGGLIGQDGDPTNGGCNNTSSGKGGTQSLGGAGGFCFSGCQGADGALGVGGIGAACAASGGGGGGGYYGGGGGAHASAGGGSSYVTVVGSSNITHTQGFNSSNGTLTITY